MGKFDGKVVLVTGSSRGLGRESALEFARQGADVAVHFANSPELADDTYTKIKQMGRHSAIFHAQFADSLSSGKAAQQIRDMISHIKILFGHLDIVIANAANSTGREPLAKALRPNRVDFNYSLNLKNGLYCLIGECLPLLEESHGTVVTISSVVTQKPEPEALMYLLTKRQVEAFSEEVADEFLRRNINIKCLRFGLIETSALQYFKDKFPGIAASIQKRPQFVSPAEEAAKQIVKYCDPDDRWFTHGTVIDLTKGLSRFNIAADVLEQKAVESDFVSSSAFESNPFMEAVPSDS